MIIMSLSLENLKKCFIVIAYVAYAVSTILKNSINIDIGYYEYVFVAVIGVCLKLSQHTEIIEKILYNIPTDDLTFIKQRLDSIVEQSVKSATPPASLTRDMYETRDMPETLINIPYGDDNASEDLQTHRSIELSNGNILRIHN